MLFDFFIAEFGKENDADSKGRSLNMACLMPLHASAKRVGAFFNISTMGFPMFFFCAGFLRENPDICRFVFCIPR